MNYKNIVDVVPKWLIISYNLKDVKKIPIYENI